jgi:hypothetical protein
VANPNLIAKVGIEVNGSKTHNIFENVIDEDLASLYPSIILSSNIDSETMIGKILAEDDDEYLGLFGEMIAEADLVSIGNHFLNLPSFEDVVENIGDFLLEEA